MDDNGWDSRLYGFKESKYEELLHEVYKLYPNGADAVAEDVQSVWAPLRLVVDDSDNRVVLNPSAKFEVPVYKEYGNEPEPKVGLVYLLQRHKPEGRVFSNWKNCGSKKVNSTIPSTLKVRYFQHKAPDLSDVRKRVITLNNDNEEAWKLVHVIHKPPRDGAPKRRRLSDQEQAPYPQPVKQNPHHLAQLASALHQEALAQPEKEQVSLSSLVPNHGPADHRIVVKVQGVEFTRRVQVVWGGVTLPDGVIYRNGHELWLETPQGRAGLSVEVYVQEVNGEASCKSNSLLYTYDHLPQDEPLLKRMRAVEDKITLFETAMSRFGPNTAHADGTSTNNNNNNSEEVEKFLTQLGNLDKVLVEARQLFRDINAHFNARSPVTAKGSHSPSQGGRGVKRSKEARTTDEHHALMALAGLAMDPTASPPRQGDSSPASSEADSPQMTEQTVHYCSTCDIHCMSQASWHEHMTSGRHLSAAVKKLGPNEFRCDACSFSSHSQQSIDMHIASASHVTASGGAAAVHANA